MAMPGMMLTMILMARQRLLLKPLASAARWLSRQGLLLKQLASAARWLSRQGLLLALWPWFSEQGRSLPFFGDFGLLSPIAAIAKQCRRDARRVRPNTARSQNSYEGGIILA